MTDDVCVDSRENAPSGRSHRLIATLVICTLIVWAVISAIGADERTFSSSDVVLSAAYGLLASALIVGGIAALITRHWTLGALLLTPVVLFGLLLLSNSSGPGLPLEPGSSISEAPG